MKHRTLLLSGALIFLIALGMVVYTVLTQQERSESQITGCSKLQVV